MDSNLVIDMTKKDDFFIPSNTIGRIENEQYGHIVPLIRTVEAFSRLSYQSVYLIDYSQHNFLYVSDNPLFLCGLSSQEVRELGYAYYLKYVPEEEQSMLVQINSGGFRLFDSLPIEERQSCYVTYDFHLLYDRKKILINHKLTPILLSDERKVWIAMCIVSLSTHDTAGHIEFHQDGKSDYWRYSLEGHRWIKQEGVVLKEEEKDMLRLASSGLTMNEIAERMCKSVDTVKFYRRNMFERLKVANITEALSFATNNKLL